MVGREAELMEVVVLVLCMVAKLVEIGSGGWDDDGLSEVEKCWVVGRKSPWLDDGAAVVWWERTPGR